MSDPVRIALVAEGPTDRIVIGAALKSILTGRSFVLNQLQPEGSIAFGPLGAGWTGVYRWCKQAAARGRGRLSGDAILFQNFDLLLVHVDADVAGMNYADDSLAPDPTDGPLPCECSCPPARATTDSLRAVVLSWCGETTVPSKTVICMPSKSTEAWVVSALFPEDRTMQSGGECLANPEKRLGVQRKRGRIKKSQADYQERADDLEREWSRIELTMGAAQRFSKEFTAALDSL